MSEVYQNHGVARRFLKGKIQGIHLKRLAVVYVRQSTIKQVKEHQESGRLQYALKARAVELGWPRAQVVVIDEDQGHSGRSAEDRSGFQSLVAEVGLNHVGLVFGVEVSRLARSNRDWYQLLDLCAVYQTLIGDMDGLYDPRSYNDRLVLGLKGTMSEAELHILKQRLDAGKWAKARRGELWMTVPMGYVHRPSGEVVKDPDEQAQGVIALIFAVFDRYRTVNGVLRYLVEHEIQLPVRELSGADKGSLRWVRASRPAVSGVLHNPIYAGAYVYGRRRVDPARKQPGRRGSGLITVAMEEWEVCLKDRLPAYISWEQYERNVRQIAANSNRPEGIGAPRQGPSLLAGLVVCGRCGLRMLAHYNQNGGGLRYVCDRRHRLYREPLCQSVCGPPIDEAISAVVLQSLEPLALELSLKVAEDLEAERARVLRHWEQRLERARYEAERAYRQYNAVEPEHRLVVRELERHWEAALQVEAELQREYERVAARQAVPLGVEDRAAIRRLAEDIPALWHAPSTTAAERQAIVRQLIERVVISVQGQSEQVQVEIQWAGGYCTHMPGIRPIARLERLSYYPQLIQRVAELWAAGKPLPEIARILTEESWRPAKGGESFTVSMVRRILARPDVRQLVERERLTDGVPKGAQEWTTDELVELIGMPRVTLYGWLKKGLLTARRTRYQHHSVWLIWADDVELARLQALREHRPYGRARRESEEAHEPT